MEKVNDMKIGFFHKRCRNQYEFEWVTEGTVALTIPNKQLLDDLINNNADTLMLFAGFALCHENDQFEKKKGRELALSRLSPLPFKLEHIRIVEGKRIYMFSCEVASNKRKFPNKTIHLIFTTTNNSDHVKLVGGDLT